MNEDWPPPGYWRDPVTGKQRQLTKAEEREANRLLAKHRDIAFGLPAERGPLPADAVAFLAGLGIDFDPFRDDVGPA